MNNLLNISPNFSTIPMNASHNVINIHLGDNEKSQKNDQQNMEGSDGITFIDKDKEDSSGVSDIFGDGKGTGNNAGTTAKNEITNHPTHSSDDNANDDIALPMDTATTGVSGVMVENGDDAADNFGDV